MITTYKLLIVIVIYVMTEFNSLISCLLLRFQLIISLVYLHGRLLKYKFIALTPSVRPAVISQLLSLGNEDDINYTCNKCNGYSDEEIIRKFQDTLKVLNKAEIRTMQEKTKLDMERQNLCLQIEESQGPRLNRLQESMMELNTKPGSYHGGDLNGVDCTKILEHVLRPDCRTYQENILLNCIADNSDRGVAFHEMFIILANVWQILRHPPKAGECGKFDDEELKLATYWCQQWAKQLPQYFPDRNLTRKGHALSCHIPETLSDYRSFYMFYKAEQLGEKVHSQFNKLMRRWASVRPKTKRLLGMAKDFEAKNRFIIRSD